MANSASSIVDNLIVAQASKEITANNFFDAASPAILGGRRDKTCSGLTWGFHGGRMLVDGVLTTVANGTLTLTASNTNYVEMTRAGVVSKNTTAFTPGQIPLYTVVTLTSTVTSYTDERCWVEPTHVKSNASFSVTTADVTLTRAQAACRRLTTTGTLTGNRNVILPNDGEWIVNNTNAGAFTTTFKTSAGSGIVVAQGTTAVLYADGTNVVRVTTDTQQGRLTKAMADANQTLSIAEASNQIIEATGALTALRDVIVPLPARQWTVFANVTGGFGVRVIGATGTGITIADGKRAIVYADGTNVVRVTADV